MFVHPETTSEYPILRQYTHHVLYDFPDDEKTRIFEISGDKRRELVSLEYGLADYFPASFRGRSILEVVSKGGRWTINLDTQKSFQEISERSDPTGPRQEAWGSALWELRSQLGHKVADLCCYRAWRALGAHSTGNVCQDFIQNLLINVREHANTKGEDATREILLRRGVASELLKPAKSDGG